MKRIATMLIFTLLFTITLNAQASIGIFAGYGQSSFDEDLFGEETKLDQTGYIPIGVQAGYNFTSMDFGKIFLGVELNYAAIPFSFELNGNIGRGSETIADFVINQLVLGPIVKVKFGKSNLNPFIRLGGGAYLGDARIEYTDAIKSVYRQETGETLNDEDIDINSAIGFNFGAGVDYKMSVSSEFFMEFTYHIVTREFDEVDTESFGANNWTVNIGAQFGIN